MRRRLLESTDWPWLFLWIRGTGIHLNKWENSFSTLDMQWYLSSGGWTVWSFTNPICSYRLIKCIAFFEAFGWRGTRLPPFDKHVRTDPSARLMTKNLERLSVIICICFVNSVYINKCLPTYGHFPIAIRTFDKYDYTKTTIIYSITTPFLILLAVQSS